MTDKPECDTCDQEKTIPSFVSGEEISDHARLREEFSIFPGEDGSDYRNLKLLGMGGMGVVYSAEDPTLQRQVALKILREPYRLNRELIAKFVNEARITAKIDHPNVVAIHQLGVNKHLGVYFSMRRISGETLLKVLARLSKNDPETRKIYSHRKLLDIFIAGCYGVAAAHEKEILHCDLKPANIMIGSFGEVMVVDWGLAREFSAKEKRDGNTISGTPAYMAPELLTGELEFPDEKTEVYALGTILHSIITWEQAPFELTLNRKSIMERVAMGKSLPLRPPKGIKLSKELIAICKKAMARSREERYPSVAELIKDLQNFRNGYPVEAYSPNRFYRFFKLCRRHPVIPLTVIAASLALVVYSFTGIILDLLNDRSLHHSTLINVEVAEKYYRKLNIGFNREADFDDKDAMLKNFIVYKDQQMQSRMAIMEFFSILDSASGFSPSGKKEFLRNYVPYIFRRILQLSVLPANYSMLNHTVEKICNSEYFDEAMNIDPTFRNMIENIRKNSGSIYLTKKGAPWKGTIQYSGSDGKVKSAATDDAGKVALPAGECKVTLDNGIKMYFRIIPGSVEVVSIPENTITPRNPLIKTIPDDHLFINIPGVGEALCRLPEFSIFPYRISQKFTHKEAEKLIEKLNSESSVKWKLPNATQLRKVWNHKLAGKEDFYGVPIPGKAVILLNNGEFFDPLFLGVSGRAPQDKGVIYLVSSNNSNDEK